MAHQELTHTGRKTLYRGIQMRSRLEADFASWLDEQVGDIWTYEPQCFASRDGQYLPDFRVCEPPGAIYIEVKPESLEDIDSVLTRMQIVWDSEPDATLQLYIWKYQDPSSAKTFFHSEEREWYWFSHDTADMVARPWPGMGRLERMCETIRSEETAKGVDF